MWTDGWKEDDYSKDRQQRVRVCGGVNTLRRLIGFETNFSKINLCKLKLNALHVIKRHQVGTQRAFVLSEEICGEEGVIYLDCVEAQLTSLKQMTFIKVFILKMFEDCRIN